MSFFCRCSEINEKGQGVGKTQEGFLVFASNWLPGEGAWLRPVQKRANYIVAEVESFKETSSDRVQPFCPHFSKCGGCQLQHMSQEAQHRYKSKTLVAHCSKEGLDLPDIEWVKGSTRGYRTKLILPIEWVEGSDIARVGFYQTHSQIIEPLQSCPVHSSILDKVVQNAPLWLEKWAQGWPAEFKKKNSPWKSLYFLYARQTGLDSSVHIALGLRESLHWPQWALFLETLIAKDIPLHGLSQVIQSEKNNVWLEGTRQFVRGSPWMSVEQKGYRFDVDPFAFQQVNPEMAKKIREKIMLWISQVNPTAFLELYCGAGLLSNALAFETGVRVVGVDTLEANIESAKRNAQEMGSGAEFICEDALKWVKKNACEDFSIWMVNPPRKGLAEPLIDLIKEKGPEYLIYMACGQKALARDAKILESFYKIEVFEAYDMFSQTVHFETLSLWKRSIA